MTRFVLDDRWWPLRIGLPVQREYRAFST